MKQSLVVLYAAACLALSGGAVFADQAHPGPASSAESTQADVIKHQDCRQCGMDRSKLSHSRMLITYADGTTVGTCSINCVVTEMKAGKGKAVKSVEVGDFATKKLIDAGKAFWVIGGDVRGVMTRIPKWAFAEQQAAEEFIRRHGGTLATYAEALALAEKD